MSDDLTPAELAELTGKKRAATQAAVLAKRGVPFRFLGASILVSRLVAQAHALLPEQAAGTGGIDFSQVRRGRP